MTLSANQEARWPSMITNSNPACLVEKPVVDFSQLSSIHPRIKECLMGQHCKNDPDEFMSCRQHSHFVRQSILGPLQVVLFESFVELDDLRCHQPNHPPEMSVSSL